MRKKLVFHQYSFRGIFDTEIQKLHMYMLKKYSYIFDDVIINICVDDTTDFELISDVKRKFVEIFGYNKNIDFIVSPNDVYRECGPFKNEIVDRIGLDDLVFFAHNKGTTNKEYYFNGIGAIKSWICGLYRYSLEFIDEVECCLISRGDLSYGSYLVKFNDSIYHLNANNWTYTGTFFWINSKRLDKCIKNKKGSVPIMNNRFYAEHFIGNIFPCDILNSCIACHTGVFGTNFDAFYNGDAINFVKIVYGDDELNNFIQYYNEALNCIKDV